MFFKLQAYSNNHIQQVGYGSSDVNATAMQQLNMGPLTIFVNTEEIKRVGYTDNGMYQIFVEFKNPPIPFISQTSFIYMQGSAEHKQLAEMINYIEGTEKF
jgi:hypothetical protein